MQLEFSELTPHEESYFADSREAMAKFAQAADRVWPPETVEEGIETLQLVHDRKFFQTVRYYQVLSICLGDLMCMMAPCRWMHLEHPNGGGPFLRWKETELGMNVLIAFEKRMEAGEEIEVRSLLRDFIDEAIAIEKADFQ